MLTVIIRQIKTALLLGFLLWLIPFVAALLISPVRSSDRALFETIMPVIITLAVTAFSIVYFSKISPGYLQESIAVGVLWLIISLVLDLLMFSWGPMAMSFTDYMKDIGLTYLIYPIVVIGIGYLLEKKHTLTG